MISLPGLVLVVFLPLVGFGGLRGLAIALGQRRLARPGPRLAPPGGVGIRAIGIATVTVVGWIGLATLERGAPTVLALFVGGAAMLAAWAIHGAPGHGRGLKYALFVPGMLLSSAALGIERALVGLLGVQWTAWLVAPPIVATLIALVWVLGVLQPDLPIRSVREIQLAHRWYHRVSTLQGPDLGSLLRFLPLHLTGIGPAFLLVRYAVKAKLHGQPFLYLRSFEDERAPEVFSEVVGPGLARHGPFVGLVRSAHRRTALDRAVPQLWRGDFATVTDGEWPTWVLDTMSRAKAVIVDVTGAGDGSEGVEWAIEQCAGLVHPERILVLTETGYSPLDPEIFPHVLVDLAQPEAARVAVAGFGGYVNASLGVADPEPRKPLRLRRSWPVVGGLFVLAGLVALALQVG